MSGVTSFAQRHQEPFVYDGQRVDVSTSFVRELNEVRWQVFELTHPLEQFLLKMIVMLGKHDCLQSERLSERLVLNL